MTSSRVRAIALAAVSVVALAACGENGYAMTPAASIAPVHGKVSTAEVTTAQVSTPAGAPYGAVLVDGRGLPLYMLSADSNGRPTCTTKPCTSIWPPLVLPSGTSEPVAGHGVDSSMLGTVPTANGPQVTYAGYPLYAYTGDGDPGVATGQGISSFGGVWWLLRPSGTPIGGA